MAFAKRKRELAEDDFAQQKHRERIIRFTTCEAKHERRQIFCRRQKDREPGFPIYSPKPVELKIFCGSFLALPIIPKVGYKLIAFAARNRTKSKDKDYNLAVNKCLYLLVKTNGTKYLRMKYRFTGKEKSHAFGVYSEVSLAEAIERRDTSRKQLRNGIDKQRPRCREEEGKTQTPY